VTDAPSSAEARGLLDTITGGLRPVRRAALGLGSNLGEREDALQGAVSSLLATPEIVVYGVSGVYETAPVGGPDQPDYLNAVLVVDTALSPRELLERAQAVEEAYGRDRAREQRWGPRTLDIDVLAVGDRTEDTADMTVPHPRLHERAFVLVPWCEVDPAFPVPGRAAVRDLLAAVDPAGVQRRADLALDVS
jgi:2-amino-4-hydroxy-6-hydroxymethyldihydropteridine diphosphokinase